MLSKLGLACEDAPQSYLHLKALPDGTPHAVRGLRWLLCDAVASLLLRPCVAFVRLVFACLSGTKCFYRLLLGSAQSSFVCHLISNSRVAALVRLFADGPIFDKSLSDHGH